MKLKTFLVGLICFLAGVGVFYGATQYLALQKENKELKEKTSTQSGKDVGLESTPAPTSEEPAEENKDSGSIQGALGYPSEGIPPLTVYALKSTDNSKYFFVDTGENQGTFSIEDVDPGTYFVVAYPKSSNSGGGYTKAVACGLSVDCNDHSLIPVTVEAGEIATGVEVKDWYAPEGTFPTKPK